ncbi:class I tRNA ligase family protein [Acidithrix ferrooxidans]|uniref:Methionine--tRNA ligase n=1 Tax=Acidithrix ferrooxidans TaxID=1280514 RepID=A0A0D8HE95_9ACTN|nr:class I tRNA ligase family protein [Acidithrix ferrooxidans]KJF16285.1 methionine--tRNA ligase [Acidithrix ferrooxidans]
MPDYFISTPIYYVNDVPHLGHAYTMINADSFSRWHRGMGDDVYFLTGTDEHGQKVAESAEKANMSVEDWCDSYSGRFRNAWSKLEVTYDDFIRTTENRHRVSVQKFLHAVYDNGYIYLAKYEGHYCVSCEAYYSDAEMESGMCPVHKRPLSVMAEENYFFRLSAFQEDILKWYESGNDVVFPDFRKNEALSFVRGGLQDISISRTSISWGIPLPWDERHVCYVWFDALINYLTGIGYGEGGPKFEARWANSHHLIGKDIIRFHCVWWPAMCMAAGLKPPTQALVHGWLLVQGEKMAKSGGNGVDPINLVETYGVEAVRYYLMREHALGSDGDFSLEALEQRYNVELANNIGNLLSRVTNIVERSLDSISPSSTGRVIDSSIVQGHVDRARDFWNGYASSRALEEVQNLVRYTNSVLEDRAPWKVSDLNELGEILGDALEVLRLVALLTSPVLVRSSRTILSAIGIDPTIIDFDFSGQLSWGEYQGGAKVLKAKPLFPRIS